MKAIYDQIGAIEFTGENAFEQIDHLVKIAEEYQEEGKSGAELLAPIEKYKQFKAVFEKKALALEGRPDLLAKLEGLRGSDQVKTMFEEIKEQTKQLINRILSVYSVKLIDAEAGLKDVSAVLERYPFLRGAREVAPDTLDKAYDLFSKKMEKALQNELCNADRNHISVGKYNTVMELVEAKLAEEADELTRVGTEGRPSFDPRKAAYLRERQERLGTLIKKNRAYAKFLAEMLKDDLKRALVQLDPEVQASVLRKINPHFKLLNDYPNNDKVSVYIGDVEELVKGDDDAPFLAFLQVIAKAIILRELTSKHLFNKYLVKENCLRGADRFRDGDLKDTFKLMVNREFLPHERTSISPYWGPDSLYANACRISTLPLQDVKRQNAYGVWNERVDLAKSSDLERRKEFEQADLPFSLVEDDEDFFARLMVIGGEDRIELMNMSAVNFEETPGGIPYREGHKENDIKLIRKYAEELADLTGYQPVDDLIETPVGKEYLTVEAAVKDAETIRRMAIAELSRIKAEDDELAQLADKYLDLLDRGADNREIGRKFATDLRDHMAKRWETKE